MGGEFKFIFKNRKCLFKTVQNKKNKKIEVFDCLKVYNSKYHKLIENSYDEIYKAAKNLIFNEKYDLIYTTVKRS